MQAIRNKNLVPSKSRLFFLGILFPSLFLSLYVPACLAEPPSFIRGDANNNQRVDLADPIFTLQYLYLGGTAPDCLDYADSDDNGIIEMADAVSTLNTLFLGKNQIAPFYPDAFYDWTTNDPNVCGDIPQWLKDFLLQNPKDQPPADPNRNPFAEPGLWEQLPPANPIMKAVGMIRLMTPLEWEHLKNINPNLYDILIQINQLNFDSIVDYQTLLNLLYTLAGWDANALMMAGVPGYVADALADAITAADSATAQEVEVSTQKIEDSLKGLSPGLHKIASGPEVNPDDSNFCYVCGNGCSSGTTDGGGAAADTGQDHSDNCGMRVAYDIYFSPDPDPKETAVNFIQQMVNEVKNNKDACCKHYVYVRLPDTGASVGANGKAAADAMKAEIDKIAGTSSTTGDQCVRKIVLNLYCFSASCAEVIHFVQNLQPCDSPCPDCKCCGESFDKIKKSINIVSLEGLFDAAPGIGGGVANLCTGAVAGLLGLVGAPGAYACSAASESYGGEEPPCVCSFNAYSRDPGAGSKDPNLKDWTIQSHQITAEDHPDVLNKMINIPELWDQIKPKCECKNTPAP